MRTFSSCQNANALRTQRLRDKYHFWLFSDKFGLKCVDSSYFRRFGYGFAPAFCGQKGGFLLEQKIALVKEFFSKFKSEVEIFKNPVKAYRTRVELGIFHQNDEIFYAMFEKRQKIIIQKIEFADEKIQSFMPLLLTKLNQNKNLSHKLFGVEFLATRKNLSTTLLYHKDIELIKEDLANLALNLHTNIIARSRGKKLVFGEEKLEQILQICGRDFTYFFNNDCFIQPNTNINEMMINWVFKKLQKQKRVDLLELYCGYGNFTLPLSKLFKRVCASEISKQNINFALENCTFNQIYNITFLRMSAEDFIKAYHKERAFYRLKDINLDEFDFSHILIDPPRAGLDEKSLKFVAEFETIVYISCNPHSLRQDCSTLFKTHELKEFSIFDQFAYTPHLECVLILEKKDKK